MLQWLSDIYYSSFYLFLAIVTFLILPFGTYFLVFHGLKKLRTRNEHLLRLLRRFKYTPYFASALMLFILVILGQVLSEPVGKTDCQVIDGQQINICVSYPRDVRLADQAATYPIVVWTEKQTLPYLTASPTARLAHFPLTHFPLSATLPTNITTTVTSSPVQKSIITTEASASSIMTITLKTAPALYLHTLTMEPLVGSQQRVTAVVRKSEDVVFRYLLSVIPGKIAISETEPLLRIFVFQPRLKSIEISPQIYVESIAHQWWRLFLQSLSWSIAVILAAFTFWDSLNQQEINRFIDQCRHTLESIDKEIIYTPLAAAYQINYLYDHLNEQRRFWNSNLWNSINHEIKQTSQKLNFEILWGAISTQAYKRNPQEVMNSLKQVRRFLEICQNEGYDTEVENVKILLKFMNRNKDKSSQCENQENIAIDCVFLLWEKYNQTVYYLCLFFLQRLLETNEKLSNELIIKFRDSDDAGRRRLLLGLPVAILPEDLQKLRIDPEYKNSYPIKVISRNTNEKLEEWLNKAGFNQNPFGMHYLEYNSLIRDVDSTPQYTIRQEMYKCQPSIMTTENPNDRFILALSFFHEAQSNLKYFPIWCPWPRNFANKENSEQSLLHFVNNSLANTWIKFLTLNPESFFELKIKSTHYTSQLQQNQLVVMLMSVCGTLQNLENKLDIVNQQVEENENNNSLVNHGEVRKKNFLVFKKECLRLAREISLPASLDIDQLTYWLSLRPKGKDVTFILLPLLNNQKLHELTQETFYHLSKLWAIEQTYLKLFIAPAQVWYSREAVINVHWDNESLEGILADRLRLAYSGESEGQLGEFVDGPTSIAIHSYHANLCRAAKGSLAKLLTLGDQILERQIRFNSNQNKFDPKIIEESIRQANSKIYGSHFR